MVSDNIPDTALPAGADGDVIAIHARIEGRVQGVWYRAWTVTEARQRGLRGWVRNRTDGSVEAVFCGPAHAVQSMIAACHDGPPNANVIKIHEEPALESGFAGFEKRPTV